MKGKFPGCVLNVTLPADMVDVNVHPAKTVVKFLNEKQVFDLVYHAASDALDRDGAPEPLHTSPRPAAQAPKPQEFYRSMTAQEWRAQNEVKRPEPPKRNAPFIAVTSASSELGGRVSVSDFVRPELLAGKAELAQQRELSDKRGVLRCGELRDHGSQQLLRWPKGWAGGSSPAIPCSSTAAWSSAPPHRRRRRRGTCRTTWSA